MKRSRILSVSKRALLVAMACLAGAVAGERYRIRLDARAATYPDPASRFQPDGPHGPSEIVDPGQYRWRDRKWPGITLKGQVLYELHIGTFTQEGTWRAAAEPLENARR